ncbi:sodium-dependent multivitamin transporter-like isoform X2 [Mizuhopecten yessoensis]|uniref:sodium-dependent multivitamin transporter-like isoform X2 n=1 Tax=Mizuhopecten yessoensis TaxID=6573 RepID=UPI000B45B6DE|nr:sodium-dependent multivitamin transporter-like isoform X2 [Mizuhopecten yessoensis]
MEDTQDIPSLKLADFLVFVAALLISLSIGVYYALSGGRQKTTKEYLLGNRNMTIIPVGLSLMVSYESSIMMLGFPAEVYTYGIMFWWFTIGFMLAQLIAIRIVVPLIHPLRVTSVYEYLELRYNNRLPRQIGTGMGMLYTIFYMGVVLYGPGTALEAVANLPLWISMVVIALAAVIYTAIGGIKAVIWTDVFQCVVMYCGIAGIIIKGCMVVGGFGRVFEINGEYGRLNYFNFDFDPTVRHTFWNLLIGTSTRLVYLTFNQTTIQRVCAVPTKRDATKIFLFAGPAFFLTFSIATFEGLVAVAYFHSIGCDPLATGQIKNPNQIIPYMVIWLFKDTPGMSGLFMASLFCASLSTLSSGLSSLSAQTVEDMVKPFWPNISDRKATTIAKLSVLFYGSLSLAVSFMIANIEGMPLSQITGQMLSAFGGASGGMFLYSIFCPWANKKGVIIGGIFGMIFIFWIGIGKSFSTTLIKEPRLPPVSLGYCHLRDSINVTSDVTNTTELFNATMTTMVTEFHEPLAHQNEGLDRLYSVSYQWIGAMGIFTTIIVASLVSIVTERGAVTEIYRNQRQRTR